MEEESDFHDIDMVFKTGITEKIWKSRHATEVIYKDNGREELTVIFKTILREVCKEKNSQTNTCPRSDFRAGHTVECSQFSLQSRLNVFE